MQNKAFVIGSFLILVVLAIGGTKPLQAEDPPGKKIFIANKCNTCHTVDSQQIKKTLASSKAPDLSKIGDKQNADWFKKYLTKTTDLNGKKHAKAWTGKAEDLTTLTGWMETLKSSDKK